jgi:hypothetical protein
MRERMRYAEAGIELEEGLLLKPWHSLVTAERQRRYHDAAEVPAGLLRRHRRPVDPRERHDPRDAAT